MTWLAAVYCVLMVTVTAQEPPLKPGASPAPAPATDDLPLPPAKVDVNPFETGDLVEVSDVTGYVQQLNVRTTILMTLVCNLVQIPNASVYRSTLRNFTTNSNRRDHFDVGIGYDDTINEAQAIALQVLTDHPAPSATSRRTTCSPAARRPSGRHATTSSLVPATCVPSGGRRPPDGHSQLPLPCARAQLRRGTLRLRYAANPKSRSR